MPRSKTRTERLQMGNSQRSSTLNPLPETSPSQPVGVMEEPGSALPVETRGLTLWHAPAVVLVLIMLALMWPAARYDSATMDEQNHIVRGLAYLRTGSLRLNRLHPPLINIISAIPLALDRRVKLPLDGQGWATSYLDLFALELLWQGNNDGPGMVRMARIPIMLLSALLAWIVFAWASEMFGRPAGIVAMALTVFCPNILAHGHLATNDLGTACFTTLAAYAFWRFLRAPGWKAGAACTLTLALALGSKFSALCLIPAFAVILVTDAVTGPPQRRRTK